MIETKYLIIGNSAGGIGACEALRQSDRDGALAIVSEEPYPVYSRPLIAKFLAGKRTFDSILYRPADFYARNRIEALLGKRVARLPLAEHLAELDSGEKVRWQKLLIATGGKPIIPPIEGVDRKGVFRFISLTDVMEIQKVVTLARKAVVIGGGLIGLSAADSLTSLGLQVTVVEMRDRILNVILDEQASALAEAAVKKAGVAVAANRTVRKIAGKASSADEVGGVILDNGESIDCDLVIVAIGVTPRTELVAGTGIKMNRGIVVDSSMATSYPDIYACGDVAECYDFVYQANRLAPIWPNAYIGGRVAGYNMAGAGARYEGGTSMNSLNYFGMAVISAGMVSGPEGQGLESLARLDGNEYARVILKGNRIAGMIFVGGIEKAGIVFGLMKDAVDVSAFKSALVAKDFTPACFPADLRAKRMERLDFNLFSRPVAAPSAR